MRGSWKTEQNCHILTPTLLAITAFLSHSPGLLNRGAGGPASLDAGFLYRILSPIRLSSKLLTSCLHPGYIMIWRPIFQPVHGQGYNILILLDRMHLLFTQVHFLFWQPGRVVGQYATYSCPILRLNKCLEKKLYKIYWRIQRAVWTISRRSNSENIICTVITFPSHKWFN